MKNRRYLIILYYVRNTRKSIQYLIIRIIGIIIRIIGTSGKILIYSIWAIIRLTVFE